MQELTVSSRFHCDVCGCDCTNLVRIKCADCPDYDLCVPCFSQGKSSGTHKPWHDYMVVEQNAYPIFESDWGADEELALIEGMKIYGVGSWQDVADHIGHRTKEEVAAHYSRVYLESETYPVPNLKRKFNVDPSEFADSRKKRIEERRAAAMIMPPPKQKPNASAPTNHEVMGYMSGRLEFEIEYENEAEVPIKDMVFEPDDNETEIELKISILNIYNSRLTSRAERKRIMLEHGLLEYRHNVAQEKKRSKTEKELLNKLKAFARVLTPADFQEFISNIFTEMQCRKRIAELQEYRLNGVRTYAMATKYEAAKVARASAKDRYNTGNAYTAISGSRHTSSRYSSDFNTPSRSAHASAPQGSIHPVHHTTTSASPYLAKDTTYSEESASSTAKATPAPQSSEPTSTNPNATATPSQNTTTGAPTSNSGTTTPAAPPVNVNAINVNAITPATATRLSELTAKIFRKPVANPLDISRATDVELLSPEEQVLCSQLRILPKPYLAIKETLFRELLRAGGILKKRTARELIKIDVNKTARIYEFFQAQRWIG